MMMMMDDDDDDDDDLDEHHTHVPNTADDGDADGYGCGSSGFSCESCRL